MGRVTSVVVVVCVGLSAGGCITADPEEAVQSPESRLPTIVPYDGPSVSPERCGTDIPVDGLDVPDVDAVARTEWVVERAGSCRLTSRTPHDLDASFMDGWVSIPDECLSEGGAYQVDGRRFRAYEVGAPAVECSPHRPAGHLEAVASWGIGDDDRLYLLDADELAVVVARPIGEPGCIVRNDNTVRIHAHGEAGCDTSDMDNDLRD
jgi:hypothetical protein